ARRPRARGDPADHRLHRPSLRRHRHAAPLDRAARLHHRRPPAAPRRPGLLAARRAAPLGDLGVLPRRPAARTPALLRLARDALLHVAHLPARRPPRLRGREPGPARNGPPRALRRYLPHPDREPPCPQPESRHRGRHRALRRPAPARGRVRYAGLALALALLTACPPLPQPRQATFHPSDAELTVTRIIHGSFVLEMHGTRLLLDPWFNSTWVMRQREALGL